MFKQCKMKKKKNTMRSYEYSWSLMSKLPSSSSSKKEEEDSTIGGGGGGRSREPLAHSCWKYICICCINFLSIILLYLPLQLLLHRLQLCLQFGVFLLKPLVLLLQPFLQESPKAGNNKQLINYHHQLTLHTCKLINRINNLS